MKSENDQKLERLMKENDILKKLVKDKITPKQALVMLFGLMNMQRDKIDLLGEGKKRIFIYLFSYYRTNEFS